MTSPATWLLLAACGRPSDSDSLPSAGLTDTSAATVSCTDAAACDDGIPCTVDLCGSDGRCRSVPTDSYCDADAPCWEATCSATEGCVLAPAAEGASCDAGTCTADQCDADGTCVAGTAPAERPWSACTTDVPCSGGQACSDRVGDVACTCDCDDGSFLWQFYTADGSSHVVPLGGSLQVTIAGDDSAWISCPADTEAALGTYLPREGEPLTELTVKAVFPCSPSGDDAPLEALAQWYADTLDGTLLDSQGSLIVLDVDWATEVGRWNFYDLVVTDLDPYSSATHSVSCDDLVTLEVQVGLAEFP